MKTVAIGPSENRTREYCLPPDLTAWVPNESLAMLVLRVVQTTGLVGAQPVIAMAEGGVLPPRMMLSLLTYCYAAGLCSSSAIERSLNCDETIRFLCAAHDPDRDSIAVFRGKNRALIEPCLEKVCLVAWKIKFGSWLWQKPARAARSAWPWIDPVLRTQILFEVKERLDKAERLDRGNSL